MTMPLNYEYFIRMAFGFVATGEMLDRWEDPAGLANTDCFTSDNIAGVKAATGYALEIMSNSVINHLNTKLADAEMKRLEITRKSARARVKRDRGCRVLKVVITEAINGD